MSDQVLTLTFSKKPIWKRIKNFYGPNEIFIKSCFSIVKGNEEEITSQAYLSEQKRLHWVSLLLFLIQAVLIVITQFLQPSIMPMC